MSFTPSENPITNPTRESYTELRPFRFWCQKVLPLVYDDSLSYYELLCKVVDYLNKTMEDVDHMNTDMDTLYSNFQEFQEGTIRIYNELVSYVNSYFDNLDVQEEINNKLNEMADDGSLNALISPFIPDIVTDWLDEHITPTSPAIDDTLSVSGAGADAKKTGDAIANQYSNEATYNVGDLVIYNGNVYKCISNITTAENWDATHWVLTNIGNNVRDSVKNIIYNGNNGYNIAQLSSPLYGNKRSVIVDAVRYAYTNIIFNFVAGIHYKITLKRNKVAPEGIVISTANDWQYVEKNIGFMVVGTDKASFLFTPTTNAQNIRLEYAETETNVTYTLEVETLNYTSPVRQLTKLVGIPKYGYLLRGLYDGESTSDHYQSFWFDVENINEVNISLDTSRYYDIYAIYDNNNVCLAYENSSSDTHVNTTIELPPNAKWFAISGNTETKLINSVVTTEIPILHSNLKGKKIVWYGTSIPAGGKDGYGNINSYPLRLGALLGATVYNEAIGSSTAHCRRSSYVTTENPYGFIEGFEPASRCLSNSLEMQEWIIEHFSSFRDAPASLTNDDKTFIRNCSYENKIDKYLTPETEPDLWVFDHGHNDYMGDEENYTESDAFSTFTFQGGMNFLINRIKAYNPHAKIIIIGDYDKQRYPNIPLYQEAVASRWEFEIIKLYDVLGWNNHTLTTTSFWRDGLWVTKGNSTSREFTYINIWCPDNIHPSSEATGKSLDFYAKTLYNYFANIKL